MKLKPVILAFILAFMSMLSSCSKAQAGWFGSTPNRELEDHKQKIIQVERQLDLQRKHTGGWEIAAAGLAVACVLLFTIGTALGSHCRKRHALQSTGI